ncbi:uncharacterized protein N7458_003158 [Penicillium daleae]|uniref:Uncharacterized protein n=1 Tax=Penicillium daleae TaxID=63821 RepID=A0AAD6CEY1_9EURO|nr:uncharacterized protein N7458_003158 [Penicillium daleae]KAJ5461606.1 hypothetical protein N7458_003158 [Penicillium daleae]
MYINADVCNDTILITSSRLTFSKKGLELPILPATPKISLDTAGIVAIADLETIQQRTALTGTSVLLDTLVICPGIHTQQKAVGLNHGEYPSTAALTSGYIFRIENPAMVYYLQRIGRTGQLTPVSVTRLHANAHWYNKLPGTFASLRTTSLLSSLAYLMAVSWAMVVIILLGLSHDWWGLSVVFVLMFARLCNIIIIRRRAQIGWTGANEPGEKGDLLVLLSQDRWVRIRGTVDDLKAVTSGQWLRDSTFCESCVTAFATLMVYLDAALASNATQFGKILLLALLMGSVGLLAIANIYATEAELHGHRIKVHGPRREYARRLHLVNELIEETGRDDWATKMGII